MCGIGGFIDGETAPGARESAVAAMCAAMVHRGPDDAGIESRRAATLGMRRLAIFDPANGHQPMVSPNRRYTLVFNGAIYNHRELRAELADWSFRTQCDTEVLLAAFARWGQDCVRRLRGMFAMAVWDEVEQSLFLARDPFGIKPLYYRHAGSRLLFASELRALLASGHCGGELDVLSAADYLAWFAVPAPRTIYRDIFSLRPGESATYRNGRLEIRSNWRFGTSAAAEPACATRREFIGQLREKLEDSVRAHVLADVPVGAFLSGGLDSAAVVGLMTRVSGARLRTFSIGFEEPQYSETDAAEETARHFGCDHQSVLLTGAEVAADVETLLGSLDQPTGDGVNTYYASRAARRGGVTVALSGLGGDELFGGYPSFHAVPRLARGLPWWRSLPSPVRRAIVGRLIGGGTRQRKLADFLHHARDIHELAALQRRVFSETRRRMLLSADTLLALADRAPFHPELSSLRADLGRAEPFEVISAWELRTYMADVLLRDSDVMSMRHSLELRVPLVDRPLVEWLWRQRADFKFDPELNKSALSEALQDLLPPAVSNRRKLGFTLPFPVWMRRELRPFLEETFSNASVDRSGLFSRRAVQQLWHGFLAGNDSREWSRVWSLAVLIAFAGRRAERSDPRRPPVATVASPQPSPASSSPFVMSSRPPFSRRLPVRRAPRTLLLAPEIFASEGGIPRILQTYLRALCEQNMPEGAVRLLALNDDMIATRDLQRCANGQLEDWCACGRSKSRFIREALRMSAGCDHLICGHVSHLPLAWLAKRLNPRLKYYLVAHGIEVWRPFTMPQRIALRGATRVLCVSDFTRRELLKHCPLPAGRAIVLHNALDPAFAIGSGVSLARCAPVILVVTRLTYADRYKGVQHMIEAMPAIRVAVPDARLRIVGRGDDLGRLQSLRNQLGLMTAVEFTGFIDDRQLAAEMESCRLFALPSRKEGFGLVFLEAMAHGRPCLGARAGGVPEVITDETGVLVEYGDVPGIAAAAVEALRRDWNEEAILGRAREFAFPPFKQRLAELLAA